MRPTILKRLKSILLAVGALTLLAVAVPGQERRLGPPTPASSVGKGMGMITPTLLEVGTQTKFFLAIADRIKMTDEQRKQISDIAFQFQKLATEKKGDLGVAEAELQRMLGRDQVDLAQVKAKLKEIRLLEGDVEYAALENVLKAIKVLTHEQHLLIMTLLTSPTIDQPKWQSQ